MYPSAILAAFALAAIPAANEAPQARSPFQDRGYYITFMRMPTYDLAEWKRIVDGVGDDGGNLLLLWMGGAFRSKKFPVTWKYNEEHENVRKDFVRELIDYAHGKGIRVLLGFTPFGYDGVNQYSLERPELKATGRDGKPTAKFGIGCWGYNLCPSRAESRAFMLDYIREMFFEFYPNADGLMIESSDYAICHCPDCGQRFFEKEFGFVRQISEEVWAKKPEAMIVVYPHYFSGAEVPGFGVRAAKLLFDPRWTLFFTPHSAHLDPALIRQARHSIWSDDSPALHRPRDIQQSALRARNAGVTGYVPSLEAFSFIATEAEEGQAWLKGRRQVPLGFGWLKATESPYRELPMRVNRIAYREFSRNPELPLEQFKETLGREVFGAAANPRLVEALLDLQAVFATDRTWCQPSPIVCPERLRAMKSQGQLTPEKRKEYETAVGKLRAIVSQNPGAKTEGERELLRIVRWVLGQWEGENCRSHDLAGLERSFWLHASLAENSRRGYWGPDYPASVSPTEKEIENAARLLTDTYAANRLYLVYHHEIPLAEAEQVFRWWRRYCPSNVQLVPTVVLRMYDTPQAQVFKPEELRRLVEFFKKSVSAQEIAVYDVYPNRDQGESLRYLAKEYPNGLIRVGIQPDEKIETPFVSAVQDTWSGFCHGKTNADWLDRGFGAETLRAWVERRNQESRRVVWDLIAVAWD